jgi:hypothetical protein
LHDLTNAWRGNITGAGEREFVGQREGDLCTLNGSRGRLRKDDNGKLVCVIERSEDARRDSMPVRDVAAEYAAYDSWIQNAWRGDRQ